MVISVVICLLRRRRRAYALRHGSAELLMAGEMAAACLVNPAAERFSDIVQQGGKPQIRFRGDAGERMQCVFPHVIAVGRGCADPARPWA